MSSRHLLGGIVLFGVGVVVGWAASAPRSGPALFQGKSKTEAAKALLDAAQGQAGKGSWENIGVARVFYLSGDKAQGQAVLDRVLSGKVKKDDWLRIGRLYAEAGDWDKAAAAFDKALQQDAKDAEYLAEIGAWYNLHGDRAKAEELFTRSFQLKDDEVWNTLNAAGSYVGVKPQ